MIIQNITWINQNSNVPSIIVADQIAREVVSKEFQKILEEEKEIEVKEVRPVEEIEKILPEEDEKEEIKREARLDLRA
jgi:hypothetical protein